MAMSPEDTARLALINRKVLAGEETRAELAEGVRILRQNRISAGIASVKAKTTAAETRKVIDPAAVLATLRGLGSKLEGNLHTPPT